MKKAIYPRKYICLKCGEVKVSNFIHRWMEGRIFHDKCERCSWKVADGHCMYTPHMIIFNFNNKIKGQIS